MIEPQAPVDQRTYVQALADISELISKLYRWGLEPKERRAALEKMRSIITEALGEKPT